ncbi:MAG: primosomal protein N' [Anaerolineae bacterium]
MFAQVVVNRPTHRRPPAGSEPLRGDTARLITYTYRLPERLRAAAAEGHLVQVPLGPSTALGVIVGLMDSPPADLPPEIEIREVAEILDPLPVVTPTQVELATWIAQEYLAPLNQSMRLMLPPGLEARTFFLVSETGDTELTGSLTAEEKAALRVLRGQGGRARASVLLRRVPGDDPEAVFHRLAEQGLVDARFTLVPVKPAPPRVQYARLLADDKAIEAALPRLGRSSKQADALLIVARRTDAPLSLTELCEAAGCTQGPVRALAERGWVEITERQTWLVAVPGAGSVDLGRAHKQSEALAALLEHGGPAEVEAFLRETGVSRGVVSALEKKGLVQRVSAEPIVLLTLPPEQVLDRVIELRGAETERRTLDVLRGTTGRVWVGGIYAQTGATLGTLRKLAERGLISLHSEEYDRPAAMGPEMPPRLTPDQEAVWRELERRMCDQGPERPGAGAGGLVALVHGVTGSGKTEIYLRAVEATLAEGKRAIVLVPEISLTAQTVRRFEARFPGRVALMHSQLSLGQRYDVWDRVRSGEADVVIGSRLALFAPLSRLGLVVVDEVHDGSYKQAEPIPLPAYHARDVAVALGRLTGATVLLGSATPDLETYYRARQGTYQLFELPQRIVVPAGRETRGIVTADLPPVRIVDLRQELRAGNRSIFSRALQKALRQTLGAGEQAILFLNRRGAATFVLCRDCGYVARCPNCDVPLTYHHPRSGSRASPAGSRAQVERLVCHHCNHREPAPAQCPECGGWRIRHFGLGTERVEETLHAFFPDARLLRWDRDTASGLDHERFLQAFVDHRADVLIGTQMIAKGLDLPLVTLVGVISADTALHLPDFRAAERTFQLLTQVAGRAGRSRRGGRVLIQTYNPGHYAIKAASGHDYAGFYQQELSYRRQLGYPPYSRLIALRFSDRDPHRCRVEAERLGRWLAAEIRRLGLPADLVGPAPCFFSRVLGRYRWQVLVRALDPMPLLHDVALPRGWSVDVDPIDLL